MTGLFQGPDGLTGTAATDADNGSLENLGIPRPPGVLGGDRRLDTPPERPAGRGGTRISPSRPP